MSKLHTAVCRASCSWASTFWMNRYKLPICKWPSAAVADGNPRSFAAWRNLKQKTFLVRIIFQSYLLCPRNRNYRAFTTAARNREVAGKANERISPSAKLSKKSCEERSRDMHCKLLEKPRQKKKRLVPSAWRFRK